MNNGVVATTDFDNDRSIYSVDEYAAKEFLDSVYNAAKQIPQKLFMDEKLRSFDPIVELAYKLYLDNGGK